MAQVQIKTPVTYYGGKQRLLKEILPRIPIHEVYDEPFFGGGAVFFGKEPAPLEIINDLNSHVVNFYFCMKLHFDELHAMVQSSLHSRRAYMDAMIMYDNPHLFNRIQRAWSFWILTNQGFAGKIGSWGYDKKSKAKVGITIFNKKLAFGKHLETRLSHTQIECESALKVIQNRDSKTTFHYVDPPYFNSNCGHYGGYTEADYNLLLEALSSIEGKFLLSSYPSSILDKYIDKNGWDTITFNHNISAGAKNKGGQRTKTEVLTANYKLT